MEASMKVLMTIIAVLALIFLIYTIIKDGHEHPFCPKCGNSLRCRRNRSGRIICKKHGDVTDKNIITGI